MNDEYPKHKSPEERSVEESLKEASNLQQKKKNFNQDDIKKQDKIKEELETFKKKITSKYKFIKGIGVIPKQANSKIESEFEISEENSKSGLTHILVVIPEKKFKEIGKIRLEIISIANEINKNFWIHVLTPVDVWNLGLDSKFDIMEALSMSYPLYDGGFLGALRVAHIHKSLVLERFSKYVTSYVIAGSLVREEETKTSDVDVFIVIDDTDVKRMPRIELKERLKSIIYSMVGRAEEIAGVKNRLEPQIYLLTDFWEAVKDAHPVMFTFIRDGIPLYDRGAFLPWKSLLRMGKIRPSPESIDMFMSSGDKMEEVVDKRLFDIVVLDIYWGIITPTQGILMLMGQAPGNVYDTVKSFRETFVKKEKLIEPKYANILEEIAIKFYKGYEHRRIKPGDIKGADVDRVKKDALEYIKRLKELRLQIEKRNGERSIEETYKELIGSLEKLTGKKGEKSIIRSFEENFIKKGKFQKKFTDNISFVISVRKKVNNSKENKKEDGGFKHKIDVERAKRYAQEIIKAVTEYMQRLDLFKMNKKRYQIKGQDRTGEVLFLKETFILDGDKIFKIPREGEIQESNQEELGKALEESENAETKISHRDINEIEKIFGNFELVSV